MVVREAWEEVENLLNFTIEDACNDKRFDVARNYENCRDIINLALVMSGWIDKRVIR